jgi:hypothetical protein
MKKAAAIITGFFLITGIAFAQTPQTPEKKAEPAAKTATTTAPAKESKDSKATCDPKKAATCTSSKSCCAHDKSAKTEKKEDAAPKK